MKRFIVILSLNLIILSLLASCGGNTSTPLDEPSQSQPGEPEEEPYPGPDQTKPAQDTTAPAVVEPYPEPDEPKPAEPGVVGLPTDHEYAPKPGDDQMTRGNVFIEESGIVLLESYPVQVKLQLVGNLPTPCHELRAVVSLSEDGEGVEVELYSLSDPDLMCTQVLEPFSASIPLGNYTEGSFTVWVNGEKFGDFELP